jgi:hypothetical protein
MQNTRLVRKLLILSVLLTLFGYLAITKQTTVGALPCCRDCIAEEEACGVDCYNAYIEGNTDDDSSYQSCLSSCHTMGNACAGTPCTTSCSGGCTDSSECGGSNCYCTGIRCTCF